MTANRTFSLSAVALMGLMAATRFHHFGDFQTLPDASLAVFFLAGLFISRPTFFAVLLLEAGLIDFIAIRYGGVSGWCVTPAYLFLIPAYGVQWLAGYGCRRLSPDNAAAVAATLLAATAATTLAFVISNLGFYGFSGRFGEMSLTEYAIRVARYLPSYLGTTLAYTGLALAGRWAVRHWRSSATAPTTP
ncbi:hypothetical protein MIT9_P0848 [Methylomarinovum caldicuralii]|uniref:Cobalamin ABC transporter n=1 Tax=Methylomarinovum caldicuralii TaxID=438856 RepID=A0AAU9C282_9GAMM|nr:hypothetical protein [Methylomarinovum caldicuralii]BCX81270.1 hypothetical protein MIT9_P0848 [Methylomarinovum caldicuralii]